MIKKINLLMIIALIIIEIQAIIIENHTKIINNIINNNYLIKIIIINNHFLNSINNKDNLNNKKIKIQN